MALAEYIRHPRRLGFIAFNLIALALIALWLMTRTDSAEAGLAGLPNVVLTTVGMAIVLAVWIGAWIAWAMMVWSRRRRRQRQSVV
jgi:hypothetical protein